MRTHITPARFLEVFGPALEEYLVQTYGKEGGHILDLLPQSSEFFAVSYHAISAVEYAENTSSKGQTTSKKK